MFDHNSREWQRDQESQALRSLQHYSGTEFSLEGWRRKVTEDGEEIFDGPKDLREPEEEKVQQHPDEEP